MKKIVVCLIATILLAGCSSKSTKTVTKTCEMAQAEGISMKLIVEAKNSNANINSITIQQIATYEYAKMDTAVSDTGKKAFEEQVKRSATSSFGEKSKATVQWGKKDITINTSVPKEQLKQIAGDENMTIKEFADSMSEQGATCK